RGHQPPRKDRASAAEGRRCRREVDSTSEVEVVVQDVDAGVKTDGSDECECGGERVEVADRPGNRQPDRHEEDGKEQERRPELLYPDSDGQGRSPKPDVS